MLGRAGEVVGGPGERRVPSPQMHLTEPKHTWVPGARPGPEPGPALAPPEEGRFLSPPEAAGVRCLAAASPSRQQHRGPRAGSQFAGGGARVCLFGTPPCKLWASGLVLAATGTVGGPWSGTLPVTKELLAPWLGSLQLLALGDAPLHRRVHAPQILNLNTF